MAKIFSENTLGECRINILIKKGERERRLERGKMTTATQPGIEPGTSRFLVFPSDGSTFFLSFIPSAGEGKSGSVILSESNLAQ